jgi:hypothetical protein
LRSFVSYYAPQRLWHRADRRTSEGRAQELALSRGWIEPLPPGSGYRILVPATETPAPSPVRWQDAA